MTIIMKKKMKKKHTVSPFDIIYDYVHIKRNLNDKLDQEYFHYPENFGESEENWGSYFNAPYGEFN